MFCGEGIVNFCPACQIGFENGDLIKVSTSLCFILVSSETNTTMHLSAAAWAVMLIHLLFTSSFVLLKDYMCATRLDSVQGFCVALEELVLLILSIQIEAAEEKCYNNNPFNRQQSR